MKRRPSLTPDTPPQRYREWLTHIFDRPVADPPWYFPTDLTIDVHFHGTPAELAALFIHTMQCCKWDLAAFSDAQVDCGLNFILNNSCSDIAIDVKDESLGVDVRMSLLRSIKTLYADCYEERCAPVLSHFDEPGATPLNHTCYMLWDVSPLLYWREDPNCALFDEVLVEVLQFALALKNPACIESALHGFGHLRQIMGPTCPTKAIITRFIETRPASPALKAYAAAAATGCVL
jgi:hypothetical protein